MRLTKKDKIKELLTFEKHKVLMVDSEYKELKLGKLEDIEELCIKMTTQPILYKKPFSKKVYKLNFTGYGYNTAYDFENNRIIVYKDSAVAIYFINNYDETWALDKKDFTKENKDEKGKKL